MKTQKNRTTGTDNTNATVALAEINSQIEALNQQRISLSEPLKQAYVEKRGELMALETEIRQLDSNWKPEPMRAKSSLKQRPLSLLVPCAYFCDCRHVNSLDPPDNHHLSAAIGWFELGNWQDANEDLEKIAPAFRAHPDVLEIRLQIYAKAKKWDPCVDLGNALVKAAPERPFGWLHRSLALYELKRTKEAAALLKPATDLSLAERTDSARLTECPRMKRIRVSPRFPRQSIWQVRFQPFQGAYAKSEKSMAGLYR
jgi:tetratricopeptide (TPR) repeat protein